LRELYDRWSSQLKAEGGSLISNYPFKWNVTVKPSMFYWVTNSCAE